MTRSKRKEVIMLGLIGCLIISSGCTVSCHLKSNGTITPAGMLTGTITTTLTDPPTCSAAISHIWVTITKVAANTSSTAGPSDSGWVTLVDLTSNPQQIDLLSLASTSCALTNLGSTTGVPAGNYQELMLSILDNTASSGPSTNNCGATNGFNCIEPNFGTVQELLLSSDVQGGLIIGPTQIAGGSINLTESQTANININFNSCASIILQSTGQYRLKPVLSGGQVTGSGSSISGTVVDNANGTPIVGAIVLLEQADINSIDRVIVSGVTASDGTFNFCPLAAGNYDVVADATTLTSATNVYGATIAFQVPAGSAMGNVPLYSEGSGTSPNVPWATLAGQVTSAGSTAADISLFPLLDATISGGALIHVTIPDLSSLSQPVTVTTVPFPSAGLACPSGTDCFNYSLTIPAGNPAVGTWSGGTITYAPPPTGNAAYSLNAQTNDCTGANLAPATVSPISVSPATTTEVSTAIGFSGCTAPF